MADKIDYVKDGEKLKVSKTVTAVNEETFTLKELLTRKELLEKDLLDYELKTSTEIASWNEAIALVNEQISQAQSLGVIK